MKSTQKHTRTLGPLARMIAQNEILWKIYRRIGNEFTSRILPWREEFLKQRILKKIGPPYCVQQGLFAGMLYCRPESFGSTLLPKLLGTYEIEIASCLEKWLGISFPIIIDIGCAEGYYAVGLARHYSNSLVYAYDICESARAMCREMGEINGVDRLMRIHGSCDKSSLLSIDLSHGGLVISDCEGYEFELFDTEVAQRLSRCHVLIELHIHPNDLNSATRVSTLVSLLSETHEVTIINSIDDDQKVRFYRSEKVSPHDPVERRVAFAEKRPWIMHWLVAKPKQGPPRDNSE
jgi:hypothetical protein